jgi:hypothetical protein
MSYFHNVWLALRGRLTQEYVDAVNDSLARLQSAWREQEQEIYDLKRNIPLMEAALTDLRDKAKRFGWEDRQKAESNKLGDAVIRDMLTQPNKFNPLEEDKE